MKNGQKNKQKTYTPSYDVKGGVIFAAAINIFIGSNINIASPGRATQYTDTSPNTQGVQIPQTVIGDSVGFTASSLKKTTKSNTVVTSKTKLIEGGEGSVCDGCKLF